MAGVLHRCVKLCSFQIRSKTLKTGMMSVYSIESQKRLSSDWTSAEQVEPPIPEYIDRGPNESIKDKRARLLYQSRKRGMTENGLLFSTFAAKYLGALTDEQLVMYDHLINKPSNDWEIYYWMTGKKLTPPQYDNEVMDMLKKHTQNDDMDIRLTQPPLYSK